MRKTNRTKRVNEVEDGKLKDSLFAELDNEYVTFPTCFVSIYLANALVYLVSSNREDENVKAVNKSITYLKTIYNFVDQSKKMVWDNASIVDIGYEFKGLTIINRREQTPEDIEKALICLTALRDLIQNKSDIIKVVRSFRYKQVMFELKQGLDLSISDENDEDQELQGFSDEN